MLFNSYEFLFVFLPIALLGVHFIGKLKTPMAVVSWLAGMSLIFYAWWNYMFLILLLISIFFNYAISYVLQKIRNEYSSSKYILFFGISVNLLVLAYYKYFTFLIENTNRIWATSLPIENVVLPIGISFFTFTQIAFLIDVYRGFAKEYKFISYVLFVTFFPHLIAGPILHHKEMMPQFETKKNLKLNWKNITVGSVIFILGLFKKVIIADTLASFATPFFMAVGQGGLPTFFESWIGAIAYSLQLYFDFSGYSDMAIGLALLFNIKLPVNFFSPYKAVSIIDFWRRWHMTLSRYLKDYLYIPLGGNRYGEYKRLRNLMITMFLGGLWHGAGWTFILWGILHGVYLSVNHIWRKIDYTLPNSASWLLTFISVVVAWVFFRADTVASGIVIIKGMFAFNGISLPGRFASDGSIFANYGVMFSGIMPLTGLSVKKVVLWIGVAMTITLLLPNVMEITAQYRPALGINKRSVETKLVKYVQWKPSYLWALILSFIAVISILSMSQTSEFLYFQF